MKNKRLLEIDGLRGIAALVVMIYHYFFGYHKYYIHSFEFPAFIELGRHGVELFFTISGFVIFWTLTNCHRSRDFIFSRFIRLFPAYWVCLIVTFAFLSMSSLPDHVITLFDLFVNLSMMQEFLDSPHIDGVYWTLSIELSFYFWMLCLFYFKKINHAEKYLFFWVLASCIFIYHRFGYDLDNKIKAFFVLQYIQFFALGVCFYKIKVASYNKWLVALVVVSVIAIFLKYPDRLALLLTFVSSLVLFATLRNIKLLTHKYLIYLGAISYPLYLIHQNVGYIIIRYSYAINLYPIIGVVTAICFSILLASFIYYFIEKPIQALAKSYYHRYYSSTYLK